MLTPLHPAHREATIMKEQSVTLPDKLKGNLFKASIKILSLFDLFNDDVINYNFFFQV